MAAIEPNIALGVKPIQIENPMNQYAAMSQIQNAQNQNALAQYQLSAAKRTDEATNIQNQLYAKHYNQDTGKINQPAYLADLAANNQGALIPKAQAQFTELEHKENINKKTVEDTKTAAIKNIREKTSDLQFNPSDDNIRAHAQDAVLHGVWTQAQADQNVKIAIALPMDQRPAYFARQGLDAEKRVVTEETARHNLETEKNQKRQTDISAGNLAVNQYNSTKPVYSEASGGFVTVPTAKNPTSTIIPLANPEATTKGQVVTKGKSLVSDVATDMATAYGVLKELKGIKSQSNAPSENVSAALQSSTIGQIGGSLLGTKEQDARDVIMSQRPILVQGIVKATGMTASQINSNQELKNLLDAATDPSKGYETNIKTLNKINKRFGLGGDIVDLSTTPVTPDKVTMGKKPTVATQNEVNTVTTSDGKTFVFPTPAAAAQFKQAAGIK